MYYKHPLVPAIKNSQNKIYNFGEKESICGNCNLPDSNCSHNCKRYKEELEKLRNGGNKVGTGKPD